MRTIRECTFETNSSSTHTLVMCNDRDLARFKEGKLFAHKYDEIGCVLNHAKLVNIDYAAKIYDRFQVEGTFGELPDLTLSQLRELMVDPLTHDDYDYPDTDRNSYYVEWNLDKHNYSDKLKDIVKNVHHTGIYNIFGADAFPKSYNYLVRATDKKDRSEKKLNVVDFTLWD
jgi:hypothetical protein